jgi:hypothetical protein
MRNRDAHLRPVRRGGALQLPSDRFRIAEQAAQTGDVEGDSPRSVPLDPRREVARDGDERIEGRTR